MSRFSRNEQAGVDLPKAKLDAESLRQALELFTYLKPYRFRFAFGMFALLGSSLLSLTFPLLAGRVVDSTLGALQPVGRGPVPTASTGLDGWGLVGVILLQAIFAYTHFMSFASVGQRALVDLRQATYSRLITLPMSFFSGRRVGELASRLSSDLTQIEDTLMVVLPQVLRQTVVLAGGIVLIALTSFRLAAVMLGLLPILVLFAVVFGRRVRRVSRDAQDRLADSATLVEETLQGIVNVKSFTNETFEVSRYRNSMGLFLDVALRGARLRATFVAFIILSLFGTIALMLWSGARMMHAGEITFGQLTRFILYTGFVASSMGHFAELFAQLQKAVGSTQRVRELLRETRELSIDAANSQHGSTSFDGKTDGTRRIHGDVTFEGVRFAYPARSGMEVLRGVDLTVRSGQRLALVGPSGAGKSTLISLLLRLYEPSAGRLLIDGRDARSYDLPALRSQMAMVPQEVLLFGGTLAENIAYGRPGATRAEIEHAAALANADGFIRSFPDGYETHVGDRGVRLSGGQRQRIAIARAILRDPAILILDEATSSLDAESERLIQEALEGLMKGRTSFIIAHRLATVRDADRIVVLSDGCIVESGTHSELESVEGGIYRRLAALQFRDGRSTPAPAPGMGVGE